MSGSKFPHPEFIERFAEFILSPAEGFKPPEPEPF
jgi:hypothetical protein